MAPSKLTDSDKRDILILYRQPGETTSTLAERYGVSNTTISRLLKNSLSEEEYELLIQQKRSSRSLTDMLPDQEDDPEEASEVDTKQLELNTAPVTSAASEVDEPDGALEVSRAPSPTSVSPDGRRLRKRSKATVEPEIEASVDPVEVAEVNATIAEEIPAASVSEYGAEATVVEEILGEELLDQNGQLLDLDEDEDEDEDDLDDEDDDLDDDDDDLDDDDDDQAEGGGISLAPVHIRSETFIKVLPLTEAFIPRPCYLVIDRTAELVARPLREFGDLGQIPEEEVQAKTLPVFDNHRVAKRFSNRTQRVIKVPDGRVLQKTSSHLQAKGITRLLIDGQVYAL